MRARSFFLSTILCSGVLALSMTIPTANAAETLDPQGSWSISKVASKQPGGNPYCAMARQFANGAALTFARNAQNETSVAIDFPEEAFKTGEGKATIGLEAGGEERSYEASPASARSVVIRM